MRLARLAVAAGAAGLVLLGTPAPGRAVEEADRLYLLGEQASADGLHGLSRTALERFLQRFPSDRRVGYATLLLGKGQLGLGNFPAALQSFRRAQSFTPPPGKPDETAFWEAETLYRMRRFEDARQLYDRILSNNATSPMAPDALYGLGWSHLELKRQAGAIDAFRQLVDSFPDHPSVPSARVQLARILIDLKRNGEAAEVLRDFGQKHRGHRLEPDARYLLAYARVGDGQVSQGLADLRDFLGAYPTHPLAPQARRTLVDLLLREGKQAALQDEYRRLMTVQPRTAEALYDAGFIATRLGRMGDAEAAWAALRSDFPRSALTGHASLDQANGAYRKNAFKEAATYARAAAGSEEPAVRAEGALLLGESELKLKRPAAALEAFRTAVDAAAPDSVVRFRALAGAGLAHEDQKQWAEAARHYDEVAAGAPDKELRAWAKTRRAAVGAKLKPAPAAPKDKRR